MPSNTNTEVMRNMLKFDLVGNKPVVAGYEVEDDTPD